MIFSTAPFTSESIIAGHGRLLAARKLGLKEVPVIILDHLSETQKRAYILADNQLALNAGWDEEALRVELAALQEEDFKVNLIGFEDDELARLLAAQDMAEGLTDEDAVPEPPGDASVGGWRPVDLRRPSCNLWRCDGTNRC